MKSGDNWSTLLLREYNELTGLNIPYPEIKFFTPDDFGSAYYYAFGGPYAPSLKNKCKDVQRAVNKRGYKYGGIDWEGQEAARAKWKEIESKNAWLKNDPTDKQ